MGDAHAGGRFDELGRFQFERLCCEVAALEFEIGGSEWPSALNAATVTAAGGIALPASSERLPGPTLVVAAWRRGVSSVDAATRVRRVVDAVLAAEPAQPRSLLVLTNVELIPDDLAGAHGLLVAVLGPRELEQLVLGRPRLRLVLPSLLGSFSDDEVLPSDARRRSTGNLAAARELASVFVPTRAYTAALAVLERFGFAVLTGPPEMGKTAIARMLGLGLLSDGWEFHECVRPEEFWERYRRDRAQVFVADDAFGSTEYRPDAAERWAVELDRVLRAMDERHWLVWTSRPAPLKAALRWIHREHGVERFPQPAEVQIDAADLEVEEKALILFRHARSARLGPAAVDLIRAHGWRIVDDVHFTPERMRRFIRSRLLGAGAVEGMSAAHVRELVRREIEEPTAAMADSLRALPDEYRAALVALLDVPPGPVSERELAAAIRRHKQTSRARDPAALVGRLADHFLRVDERGAVAWVHPSWRDLVIDDLASSPEERRRFLGICTIDGILLALSLGGGSAGTRELPLLQEEADWDAATGALFRLVPDLDEPATTRLLVALADAIDAAGWRREPELDALAVYALELLARGWNAHKQPVPVGLLGRWLELRAALPSQPPVPELAPTWIELLPPVGGTPTPSVAAFGDWLTLVELLAEHASEQLERFSSAEQREKIATGFVDATAELAVESDEVGELVELLRRLVHALPAVAGSAQLAILRLKQSGAAIEPSDTYTPRPISPELQRLLETRAQPPSRRNQALVARVLADL